LRNDLNVVSGRLQLLTRHHDRLRAALAALEQEMSGVEDDVYSTTAATVHACADRIAAILKEAEPPTGGRDESTSPR